MRKLFFLIKAVVVIMLLSSTGIFSLFSWVASDAYEYKGDHRLSIVLWDLSNKQFERVEAKEKAGETYSPWDYFDDLADLCRIADSLDLPVSFGDMSKLQRKMHSFISEEMFTYDDLVAARDEFNNRDEEYIRKAFPRPNGEAPNWRKIFHETFSWVSSQYWEGMPLALVLFLVWLYREEDEELRFSLKSPVSFVISLLLYPLILHIVLKTWFSNIFRGWYAEIELRRTKDRFFSILSEDEIKSIQGFARSNLSLRSWREILIHEGCVFKHSFASALFATAICMIIYGCPYAYADTDINFSKPTHTYSAQAEQSGPLIQKADTNQVEVISKYTVMFDCFSVVKLLVSSFEKLVDSLMKESGVNRKIEHVPITLPCFSFVRITDNC